MSDLLQAIRGDDYGARQAEDACQDHRAGAGVAEHWC